MEKENKTILKHTLLCGGIGILTLISLKLFKKVFDTWKKNHKNKKEENGPQKYKIIEKTYLTKGTTHPVVKFKLATQDETKNLGIDIGDHIKIYNDDKSIFRPYTPITHIDTKGYFEVVFKIYNKVNDKPAGKLSQFLKTKNVGDHLLIAVPMKGHKIRKSTKNVTLVAGGTGITPCYQALLHWLEDSENKQGRITLLYANSTEEDIILKKYLDELQDTYKDQLKIVYLVSRPSGNWKGIKGRINKELINRFIPSLEKEPSQQVGICGPAPFVKSVRSILQERGMKRKTHFFVY
mmetsp:Transcript_364/g.657  ORF Transcript_364/g.657 Transcript_364/m.657 type:complete len:294 (+) Transcript_364:54-935(+)